MTVLSSPHSFNLFELEAVNFVFRPCFVISLGPLKRKFFITI